MTEYKHKVQKAYYTSAKIKVIKTKNWQYYKLTCSLMIVIRNFNFRQYMESDVFVEN